MHIIGQSIPKHDGIKKWTSIPRPAYGPLVPSDLGRVCVRAENPTHKSGPIQFLIMGDNPYILVINSGTRED